MNLVFKILLTFNSTVWMWLIYIVKAGIMTSVIRFSIVGMALLCVPVFFSFLSLKLVTKLGSDTLSEIQEFSLADNEFLPTYLGYFFVSLSVSNIETMIFLYFIVFVFVFLSQTQYFNPIYILFGYHYYHILTANGTRIFVLKKGRVVRNKHDMCFDELKRLNDTTYIDLKQKG